MNRTQILWLQSWIALSGAVFWCLPPQLPHTPYVVVVSALWGLFGLSSIFLENLEVWTYRLSAFFGFLLCTIEGMLGLTGLVEKPGLLLMAFFHGSTFILSVVGKYLSQSRSRPKTVYDQLSKP